VSSKTDPRPAEPAAPTLHLSRWTITSGSNTRSRGAVVLTAGDHAWDAVAEGNGPVDALYRAVDAALAGVLAGHPRLVAYDIHAVAEGPDSEGVVMVEIAPPVGATGARAGGRYGGKATSTNIIAASIEAYLEAINELLAEEHWAGATEQAGNRRRAKGATASRAEFDEDEADHDTTAWFER
jgi:2-isopropylmalate synthase